MLITPRERTLRRLRSSISSGRSLLGVGAGTGLVAESAESGGADLVIVFASGRFRRAGLSSLSALLPFANANEIVLDLLPEILSAVRSVPVIAALCATDPFLDVDDMLSSLVEMGVAGVQNFPTIAMYGDEFRADLEATGISFESEVELMRAARRAGLLGCAYATDVDGARRLALAGADVIIPLLGVTKKTTDIAPSHEAALIVRRIAEGALAVRNDVIVLFHGGAVVTPIDVREVLVRVPIASGYIAASLVERTPVRDAVRAATLSLQVASAKGDDASRLNGSTRPDFSEPPPIIALELNTTTLGEYLHSRSLVARDEEITVDELAGGVSNMVLRWTAGEKTGVVKQSRARLRVEEEWLSDVRRILNERDAIFLLGDRLRGASTPTVTFTDEENLVFGMTAIPSEAPLWKTELFAGKIEQRYAEAAGRLLCEIHETTRNDPIVAERFAARPLLDQNRLDPWYRAAALHHPDLKAVFEYAIERLVTVTEVLVHGDFVPKNMFLVGDGLILLDYEVAHYGNAGYDTATFINHMLLKGYLFADRRHDFCQLAQVMWRCYGEGISNSRRAFVEQETLLQLGALMLARVDGKSKVEYLVGHPASEEARNFGRWLLWSRPASLSDVFAEYEKVEGTFDAR